MSLVSRTWFIQGGIFVLFVEGAANGRPPYPRLQLVEGRLCETPSEMKTDEGKTVIDGCQIDERGRTIGYYIAEETWDGKKVFGMPKPADKVIHVFEPSRTGQYRELTMLHAVMNELRDLKDLHDLEMIACKDAATISNVVKTGTGELNATTILRNKSTATQQAISATGVDNTEYRAQYVSNALGGRTVGLRLNETLEQHRTDRPSVVTRDYWKYKTELVCNGVGIPYCMAFPDSMQGTVYRGALDMAATFFQQRFGVISEVCRRIYVRNMEWARINVPTLRDAPGDWQNVIIRAPRAPNVDVGYNSAAALAELAAGACNYSMIYGPRGIDWREAMDALNEELQYAEKIGLTERLAKLQAAQKAMSEPSSGTVPIKQAADAGYPEE